MLANRRLLRALPLALACLLAPTASAGAAQWSDPSVVLGPVVGAPIDGPAVVVPADGTPLLAGASGASR